MGSEPDVFLTHVRSNQLREKNSTHSDGTNNDDAEHAETTGLIPDVVKWRDAAGE